MFVREGGASDNPQRTLKEQNVFAVLKQLGFSSDLFAMQSEMWFYTNTMADNIAYREQIGAEPRNRGKNVDDMLLLSEMEQSLKTIRRVSILLFCIPKGHTTATISVTRAISPNGRLSASALTRTVASRS